MPPGPPYGLRWVYPNFWDSTTTTPGASGIPSQPVGIRAIRYLHLQSVQRTRRWESVKAGLQLVGSLGACLQALTRSTLGILQAGEWRADCLPLRGARPLLNRDFLRVNPNNLPRGRPGWTDGLGPPPNEGVEDGVSAADGWSGWSHSLTRR